MWRGNRGEGGDGFGLARWQHVWSSHRSVCKVRYKYTSGWIVLGYMGCCVLPLYWLSFSRLTGVLFKPLIGWVSDQGVIRKVNTHKLKRKLWGDKVGRNTVIAQQLDLHKDRYAGYSSLTRGS